MLCILLFSALFAYSYGDMSTNCNFAWSVVNTQDGGFMAAGNAWLYGPGDHDYWIAKLDGLGQMSYSRAFGWPSNDYCHSVIQTPDGGYALAGFGYRPTGDSNDVLVIRLDTSGHMAWARAFGGADRDRAYSIIADGDKGFVVAGYSESFGSGNQDFLVLRLDSLGGLMWARTFGGPWCDSAWSVIRTVDGDFLVAGTTNGFGAGGMDFLLVKVDPMGNLIWARTYGSTILDDAFGLAPCQDGGFVVAGRTNGFGAQGTDFLVMRAEADGNPLWATVVGGPQTEFCYSVCSTYDGGFAAGGFTSSFGGGSWDQMIIKLDSLGNLLWTTTIGWEWGDFIYSIAEAPDHALVIAGTSENTWGGFMVAKVGEDGSYPSCAMGASPSVMSVTLITNPAPLEVDSPLIFAVTASIGEVTTYKLRYKMCDLLEAEEEAGDKTGGVRVLLAPGGATFFSPGPVELRIYSSSGRLVHQELLHQGENPVSLVRGIYFWIAEKFKGNVVVR